MGRIQEKIDGESALKSRECGKKEKHRVIAIYIKYDIMSVRYKNFTLNDILGELCTQLSTLMIIITLVEIKFTEQDIITHSSTCEELLQ